jgi:hypothetical protein
MFQTEPALLPVSKHSCSWRPGPVLLSHPDSAHHSQGMLRGPICLWAHSCLQAQAITRMIQHHLSFTTATISEVVFLRPASCLLTSTDQLACTGTIFFQCFCLHVPASNCTFKFCLTFLFFLGGGRWHQLWLSLFSELWANWAWPRDLDNGKGKPAALLGVGLESGTSPVPFSPHSLSEGTLKPHRQAHLPETQHWWLCQQVGGNMNSILMGYANQLMEMWILLAVKTFVYCYFRSGIVPMNVRLTDRDTNPEVHSSTC